MIARPDLLTPPVAAAPGFPTPGYEAADEPLGLPPQAPVEGGTHVFVDEQSDGETPVAYDPCRPIHYVIRPDNAPIGGEAVLRDAFARVTAVTGLQFVYDGPTDEQPSLDRELFQSDRYGDRWAPVVVAWQTEDENPSFRTDIVGEAGSASVRYGRHEVFVTGGVSLDEAEFQVLLATPEGAAAARAIVLHELGHLVGLDHVPDPNQLMHPSSHEVLDFAAGDLTGLSALGQGECVPGL